MNSERYLLVYVEPTPYILGLVREINNRLRERVIVLFLRENASQKWDLSLEGLNVEVLPKSFRDAAGRMYAVLKSTPLGILHLAGWGDKLLLFALVAAWLRRLPAVVESDTQMPFEIPAWKAALKKVLYPLLFQLPSFFLPGGTRQANYLRYYGVPDSKLAIARMTVDVTQIIRDCEALGAVGRSSIRKKMGFSDVNVIFTFVGRLLDLKGLRELIPAFAKVILSFPSARLIIAGDGPEEEYVRTMAGSNLAIRYLGKLGFRDIIKVYRMSDVVVVPSHRDAWGLVVNEAMAAGLPVIATDRVGCVDDLVKHSETGYVVPAFDTSALSNAMLTMAADGDARKKMGMNAKNLISSWTLEDEADRIVSTWEKIANK